MEYCNNNDDDEKYAGGDRFPKAAKTNIFKTKEGK